MTIRTSSGPSRQGPGKAGEGVDGEPHYGTDRHLFSLSSRRASPIGWSVSLGGNAAERWPIPRRRRPVCFTPSSRRNRPAGRRCRSPSCRSPAPTSPVYGRGSPPSNLLMPHRRGARRWRRRGWLRESHRRFAPARHWKRPSGRRKMGWPPTGCSAMNRRAP
jgi:hypothetical protein